MKNLPSIFKTLLITLIAVFTPAQGAILTALLLLCLDLVTGLLSSRKQGIPITSSGLKRSIVKLVVYELAICLSFLVTTYLIPIVPVMNLVAGLIGVTELTSIMENVNTVAGGNLLKSIIDSLNNSNNPPPAA